MCCCDHQGGNRQDEREGINPFSLALQKTFILCYNIIGEGLATFSSFGSRLARGLGQVVSPTEKKKWHNHPKGERYVTLQQ